jgi:FkbM family methyltransferase
MSIESVTHKWPWIIYIESADGDNRYGVQAGDIQTGNDGDVCMSILTHQLLQKKTAPYVIDIGLDEGWWSTFVTEINPSAIIDAFEPNPESFTAMVPRLTSLPRLRLHNFAISDHSGFLPFNSQKGQSHSRNPESTQKVPCTTLERYIENRHVDMIKIDTEGHDICILRTLHPYLSMIDAIVFECTVFWNGRTEQECVEVTQNELLYLKQQYRYMYSLSRRAFPPYLITLTSDQDIIEFVQHCNIHHLQVDILVCNEPISI